MRRGSRVDGPATSPGRMMEGPSAPRGLLPSVGPSAISRPPLPSPAATSSDAPANRNSRRATCARAITLHSKLKSQFLKVF